MWVCLVFWRFGCKLRCNALAAQEALSLLRLSSETSWWCADGYGPDPVEAFGNVIIYIYALLSASEHVLRKKGRVACKFVWRYSETSVEVVCVCVWASLDVTQYIWSWGEFDKDMQKVDKRVFFSFNSQFNGNHEIDCAIALVHKY